MTKMPQRRWKRPEARQILFIEGSTMVRIKQIAGRVEIGKAFGKWSVLGYPFSIGNSRWMAVCRCDCGRIGTVDCKYLSNVTSSGCKSCSVAAKNFTHGESLTRLYKIWAGIKKRCLNPNATNWQFYGGRGIAICDEWLDYTPFRLWAIDNGYDDSKEIDRLRNSGNYEPSNCRWVTRKRNCRNTRSTRMVTAFGETKSLIDWSEDDRCCVAYDTVKARLAYGWEPEKAITHKLRGVAA